MQKLSTVNVFMGLIWDLFLQENALFYGKSVFVTFLNLALLSQVFELSQERNMPLVIFKSCHSDQR